jgi:hypothetical protein
MSFRLGLAWLLGERESCFEHHRANPKRRRPECESARRARSFFAGKDPVSRRLSSPMGFSEKRIMGLAWVSPHSDTLLFLDLLPETNSTDFSKICLSLR